MNCNEITGAAIIAKMGLPVLSSKTRITSVWDTPFRWKVIRDYYAKVTPAILSGYRPDPYELGLYEFFTPIEKAVWEEIRYHGLPFYPQYPVGRRFVDFGDPIMQLAIEVDGKAFHSREIDAPRDAEIAAQGWQMMRITGGQALYRENILSAIMGVYGRNEDGSRHRDDDGEG